MTNGVARARRVEARHLALVLLAAALATSALAFSAKPNVDLQPWYVLGLWASSIGLFLAGAYRLERRGPHVTRAPFTWLEIGFVLAITVAALLIRIVALDHIPHSFGGDEGESGSFSRSVLAGDVRDPFTTGWAGHPTLWFFVQALSLKVLGDDVFGLRALSALLGTATVPVVYLVARAPFGRRVAASSAILLAAYQLHVHYSRIGVNSIGDGFFMLVAVAALLAGLRDRSPSKIALAGAAAGLAQHFYLGSRLVPVVVAAVVLHQLVWNRASIAPSFRYLPLLALGFLVGYGPGVRVPLYQWNDYNARLRQVGVFQSGWFDARRELGDSALDIAWFQMRQSFGAFTHVVDESADYWSQMPLLDTVSSLFFVVGLAAALATWRRAESAALVAWVAGTAIVGGVLLVSPPQSHRYVIVAPAACILVALGVERTSALARDLLPHGSAPIAAAATTAVLVIALWNLDFYFRDYSSRYTYGGFHQGEEFTAMGTYLRGQGRGSYVYLLGAPWMFLDNGTVRFLAPDTAGVDVEQRLTGIDVLPPRAPGRAPLFVVLAGRLPELAVIRNAYPTGTTRRFASKVDGQLLFVAYEPAVPGDQRSATSGALAVERPVAEREHSPGCLDDDGEGHLRLPGSARCERDRHLANS